MKNCHWKILVHFSWAKWLLLYLAKLCYWCIWRTRNAFRHLTVRWILPSFELLWVSHVIDSRLYIAIISFSWQPKAPQMLRNRVCPCWWLPRFPLRCYLLPSEFANAQLLFRKKEKETNKQKKGVAWTVSTSLLNNFLTLSKFKEYSISQLMLHNCFKFGSRNLHWLTCKNK